MSIASGTVGLLIFTTISALILAGGCVEKERTPLPCMERAVFGDTSQSAYILPYPVGDSYRLMQGYCYPNGGHRNQLAYDFETPVGTPVIAARSGEVMKVRSDLPDDGRQPQSGQHNHIMIRHEDGTALYRIDAWADDFFKQPRNCRSIRVPGLTCPWAGRNRALPRDL